MVLARIKHELDCFIWSLGPSLLAFIIVFYSLIVVCRFYRVLLFAFALLYIFDDLILLALASALLFFKTLEYSLSRDEGLYRLAISVEPDYLILLTCRNGVAISEF
ncbi:hypothetical protein GALMADRAFT_402727 [Galerina marginata CBS 339.88]|uniref:Uncharacterized protein n=1 Tax=Galerina marginata (strain CBS 339.88) TaxID=685588 RepID=A0A067TUT6_GALM3|nr:hypothetical protein GALMADRAFT_402727 [Galerina marginata CBS 339.88]